MNDPIPFKGMPLEAERRRAESEAAFLAARRIYFQNTVQWGIERRVYYATVDELRTFLRGGAPFKQLNSPADQSSSLFHAVEYNGRTFMSVTSRPLSLE